MCGKMRTLILLLYKCYLVRKRHYFALCFELALPVIIIIAALTVRSGYDIEPRHVNTSSYYRTWNKADLINDHVQKSIIHLYYKPKNEFIDKLMENVTRCMELPHDQLSGFETEDDMLQRYEVQQGKDEMISVLAIDFGGTKFDSGSLPKKLTYTIQSSQPIPVNLFDTEGLNRASDELIEETPIVPLQMCLDGSFIDKVAPPSGDRVTKPMFVIQKMPYPPYDEISPSEISIQYTLYTLGGLIFFATIVLIPAYVSAEKTTGVNALLRVNGVKAYENFLSWLGSGMLFNILSIFGITALLSSNLYDQKPLYYHSNWAIIGLSLFLNITHIYAYCLHVASYFSKAWLAQMMATTVSVLVHICTIQFEKTQYFGIYVPYFGILCPIVSTSRIFDELNKRENELTGATWNNVFESVHPALNMTGSLGFIMLSSLLGIIIHFVLAVYFDAVLPSKYSVQKSPLFFLDIFTHFWKRNKVDNVDSPTDFCGQAEILEPVVPGTFTPWIQLQTLTKCFESYSFPSESGKSHVVEAIRGISIDFYKGVITALLGHNGAGKSTTFSILTGLTSPTKGKVYINNKDISQDPDAVRSDLGVCSQENTIFPDLTVQEQLGLIGSLKQKDKTRKQISYDVEEMLAKLDMTKKRNAMPDQLSGGQKRRLCLGMALIGNASTIFLDEPTSGMDPETRRGTWDLILKYRNRKTIIISTHSMEEADVLGDRIAIMQSGRLKCYGTPMFLKKHYGHNYHEITLSTTSRRNKAKIEEIVGSEATINATHYGRIVLTIPFTSSLPEILDNMEKDKVDLGITGISVSTITLEQVFLKAAEMDENKKSTDYVDGKEEPTAKEDKKLQGSELTRQKLNALIRKKITYFKSDKNLFIAMICGALLAVTLPVVIYSGNLDKTNDIYLGLSLYQNPEVLIHSKNTKLADTFKNIIESEGGTGTLTQTDVSLSDQILSRASIDLTHYKTRMIISAEFDKNASATGIYSGGATLSAPIVVNTMSNLVLKAVAGNQYSIVASIGDLPRSLRQDACEKAFIAMWITASTLSFITLFFHVIALFVKHPLLENSTKIKQLQRMAGASTSLYWGTMFLVDYAFYILLTVLSISGIFATDYFGKLNTIRLAEVGILLLLFLLFGINVLLYTYIHSFISKRFHLVYSILAGIPLLLSYLMVVASNVLPHVENAKKANILQRRIFSLEPHVSFVFGYMKFSEIAFQNARCRGLSNRLNEAACVVGNPCCDMKCFDGRCANPLPYFGNFSSDGGFEEFVIYLLFTPIILVGILYLLEEKWFLKLLSKSKMKKSIRKDRYKELDSQVKREKSIVHQAINHSLCSEDEDDENVFLAYELSKRYGDLEAVEEVNFRVKKNECFGLLGVNGAGKSTTFRMLVGEEVPTSGILRRGSFSMKTNRTEYLKDIGYCPQNDALIPYFNAVEILTLFAQLRGVPSSNVESEVDSWMDKLQLKTYAINPCGNYSGGNKRRLNIAMALIASPKLVLLDEPTTGVDPAAKRSVWTILQDCQKSGQAIVLTSHSMEECEVLCNRLVIMARGRLLCDGACQELKKRFGAGFNITIKLDPERSQDHFFRIKKKMEDSFICELKDEHPGYLLYHITDDSTTWVKMFGEMNELKSKYDCIQDFIVSTSTLEQLFMQLARSSADPASESRSIDSNKEYVV